jgi:hypothetical protein
MLIQEQSTRLLILHLVRMGSSENAKIQSIWSTCLLPTFYRQTKPTKKLMTIIQWRTSSCSTHRRHRCQMAPMRVSVCRRSLRALPDITYLLHRYHHHVNGNAPQVGNHLLIFLISFRPSQLTVALSSDPFLQDRLAFFLPNHHPSKLRGPHHLCRNLLHRHTRQTILRLSHMTSLPFRRCRNGICLPPDRPVPLTLTFHDYLPHRPSRH